MALAAALVVGAATPVHAAHPVRHHGDSPSSARASRISATPSGDGYYTMDVGGGVFTHGDAAFHGSVPQLRERGHAIGPAGLIDLSVTTTGDGYWILDGAGGIFTFGDAGFIGSVPTLANEGHPVGPAPVVDLGPTSTDAGYYVADADGGVFAFGDARFSGSIPGLREQGHQIGPARAVAITPTARGRGYWILDDRGGVFSFGDAPYFGSLPERGVIAQAIDMEATPDGAGYWVSTRGGGVHAFGSAEFFGRAAAPRDAPAVDFAASPHGAGYWVLLENGVVVTRDPAPAFASSVAPVTAQELHASWRPGCPVPPEQLRSVSASHWGFDGAVLTGRLVVHVDHVDRIRAVLRDLYDVRFPIGRMEPVEAFGGSDEASMEANNTSAFNCRRVTGGSSWSEHAFGRAIDVNPVQNPYVIGSSVSPAAGRAHLDRSTPAPGKIQADDAVVRSFAAQGWSWGGFWDSPKDYQHFSATGR